MPRPDHIRLPTFGPEDDEAVRAFIAKNGVQRLPAAAAAPTTGTVDQDALRAATADRISPMSVPQVVAKSRQMRSETDTAVRALIEEEIRERWTTPTLVKLKLGRRREALRRRGLLP